MENGEICRELIVAGCRCVREYGTTDEGASRSVLETWLELSSLIGPLIGRGVDEETEELRDVAELLAIRVVLDRSALPSVPRSQASWTVVAPATRTRFQAQPWE